MRCPRFLNALSKLHEDSLNIIITIRCLSAMSGDTMKVECYFKEAPPSVDWYRGAIPVKTDPRVTIFYDPVKLYASMEMKKCKINDEAKYRAQVEDAEGEETLEFAGFSLFVKGTTRTTTSCVTCSGPATVPTPPASDE